MTPTERSRRRRSVAGGVRTGLGESEIQRDLLDNLFYCLAKFPMVATRNDYYLALAQTVRDRLLHRWIHTAHKYLDTKCRTVAYLSAEYLPGPHLGDNLLKLGIYDDVKQAVESLGLELHDLLEQEEEPGLGNGGLGRLAACFMDSLATLQIPAIGYGIRYEFGIFDQAIRDGWQQEITDKWLRFGNPWEIIRPEIGFTVKLGGHTRPGRDAEGRYCVEWLPERVVKGIPCDTPVAGYGVNNVNLLRLWQAQASESFDFQAFNVGDYYGAVREKVVSETITKVLYPNDEPEAGKGLRLEQQFFFVSCSLQDMIRLYQQREKDLGQFHRKFAVQLNDTHPAIGVAELMRLLVDEHGLPWEPAWDVTSNTFAYTNHTLLPEALETWSLELLRSLLPRHLEIIYEINQRFLDQVRLRYPHDPERLAALSLIDERGGRRVRMANLACVGSHKVNGVAALHTELLKRDVLAPFHDLWPDKFCNRTNGVTPRRFLLLCNPRLAALISSRIGDGWVTDLERLRGLEDVADDTDFQQQWRQVKMQNKRDLARVLAQRTGIVVSPDSMFDIQAKRIHEYKRQHLNVLHVVSRYARLKAQPDLEMTPRTVIFGGKAAPSYDMAKLIIKLINSVAETVNHDPDVGDRLKVAFFPDFNVQNAQRIYPAAELSEQISTAGKEASGTGNMKFALNGALTIGTLDGANIEIRNEVGEENFFLFGLTADELRQRQAQGYSPGEVYAGDAELRQALDMIADGAFSRGDRKLFQPLVEILLRYDPFFVLADYRAYVECQAAVEQAYRDEAKWARMSILNVARMGRFSSDRAVREYCDGIWHVKPVPVDLS